MLLCDGCDRGCHTGCARLHRLPSSPTWFCCLCSASAATKNESGAAAAAAAPATQLPPQRGGRLKQEGESSGAADAAVMLVNSEDDSDLFAPPLTAPKVNKQHFEGSCQLPGQVDLLAMPVTLAETYCAVCLCSFASDPSHACLLAWPLQTTGGRMQLLAAERRLNAAQRRLSAGERLSVHLGLCRRDNALLSCAPQNELYSLTFRPQAAAHLGS